MSKKSAVRPTKLQVVEGKRSYQELISVGGQNKDWAIQMMGEDAQIFGNISLLRARTRDLYDCNGYMKAYVRELCTNTFGATGMVLSSDVQETEDRVVYAPDEKAYLLWYQRRVERVRERVARKTGQQLPEFRVFETNERGQATVKVGEPDLYAQRVIEQGFTEWKKARNCDVRGTRPYTMLCNMRLIGASRDGGHFIRHIRDPKVNDFGYAIQSVNDEWCDYWLNTTLPNGNEIRMGIEYQKHSWGLGKPVAYYFIKRQPQDWMWGIAGGMGGGLNPVSHDRIPAEDIIHYANYTDCDNTRPAPWGVASIPKSRQLDQYELYEVIAARLQACKTGWLYSDLVPEGGVPGDKLPDPNKVKVSAEPGGIYGLPYGVKFQESDPKHPNGNYPAFRTAMLRGWCAGLPAACFSVIGQDYSQINFSAGRLEKLTVTEAYKVIQQFDIMQAGDSLFENFLEMALMKRAIPLPFTKLRKLMPHSFQPRGWEGVDPIKEANANALNVANKFDTRTEICARSGRDFKEVVMKLAEEEAFMEEWGINPGTTVAIPPTEPEEETNGDTEETETDTKPKPKKGGKKK